MLYGIFQAIDYLRPSTRHSYALAQSLYNGAISLARMPIFYRDFNVADSKEGRVAMVVIMVTIIMVAIKKSNHKRQAILRQALSNHMVNDFEVNLREMGVGDLSVPRKMRALMKSAIGFSQNFALCLDIDDITKRHHEITASFQRNIDFTDDKTQQYDDLIALILDYHQRFCDCQVVSDEDDYINTLLAVQSDIKAGK